MTAPTTGLVATFFPARHPQRRRAESRRVAGTTVPLAIAAHAARVTIVVRVALVAVLAVGGMLAVWTPAARADELSDLSAVLSRLPATEEIQGSIEFQVARQSTEEHWTDQSHATLEVEDGPQGFRLGLPHGGAKLALQELRGQVLDPSKHTPTYSALNALNLNEISGDLDSAAPLAQDVALSHLVEVKPATYNGRAARLLVLTLPPRLSVEARKHVRTADSRLSVWVGADGMPLGAEKIEHTRGRFLVLFFESERKQTWVYGRKGNRLFATRHEVTDNASGLGQDFRSSTVAVLTLH